MRILSESLVKSLSRYVNRRNSSSFNPFHYPRHMHVENLESNKMNKLPLIRRSNGDDDIPYFSVLSTEKWKYFSPENNIYLPFVNIHPCPVDVRGCCDGVLCLEDDAMEGNVVLWNPWTQEFKFLPQSSVKRHPSAACIEFYSSGFGFDRVCQDYKVIRFVQNVFQTEEGSYGGTESHAEIYSLKSDSWKEIPNPKTYAWPSPSTYVDGVFYWVADGETDDCVLSFDFAKEKFSFFPFPKAGKPMGPYTLELLQFDGLLAAIIYPELGTEKSFDLWVMNEGSWTGVSDFRVSGAENPLGFWTKDELFFEGINRELLLYNLATQELKHLGIYDHPETMQLIPCARSSVRLNRKSKFKESYAKNEEAEVATKQLQSAPTGDRSIRGSRVGRQRAR